MMMLQRFSIVSYSFLLLEIISWSKHHQVDGASVSSSLDVCQTHILVSVFSAIGLCLIVTLSILLFCTLAKRRKRRLGDSHAQSHKMNDIEGRRNKVYEDDGDVKDEDEFPSGRKRQDSGFVASSNESIVPLPEMHSSMGPRRSPSMPNLRIGSGEMVQNTNGEVFTGVASVQTHLTVPKPMMVSIGTSTEDLSVIDQPGGIASTQGVQANTRLIESVVIQKKSFNCTGIDFGIGGVYVKDFDPKEISFKKGVLSVGDEVVSINDYPLNGLTDMEAFSFFAKSGPDVKLKVAKGVFIDKAEGMSISSADFQMSETSNEEEAIEKFPRDAAAFASGEVTNASNANRLPRVIADANNMSFDGTVDHSQDLFLQQKHSTSSLLLKTIQTNGGSQGNRSLEPDTHTGMPNSKYSSNDLSNGHQSQPPHQNGVHPNVALESQEITKILLANPGLFTEFLASVQAKEKAQGKTSRGNSDSSECCVHSRNASSERNRQHSRHSSNEQCCHGAYSYQTGSEHRHTRNCSCESSRYTHTEHHPNEQTYPQFVRANSSDDTMHQAGPFNSGLVYRSQSGDGNSPIFTVDSYARQPEQGQVSRPVIDTSQQQQTEREQRLYYQDLLKQKATLEQQLVHQQNKSNELVNGHAHHENVVVQRGYNNDYIVPVNGAQFPSVTTTYAKTIHRSKDSSPVRRTSPVIFTAQSVPRFASNSSSSTPTEYRSNVPQSNSPQSSMSSATARKPPPDYSSIKRSSSDNSDTSGSRESIEIDADFMRKMTQKYSEPRFRKNPPPYNAAVSFNSNDSGISTTGEGVILRHLGNEARTINRSRPHSYTETGVLITDASSIQSQANNSIDGSEIRKHPKRTHSMPAVKQSELRPVAAQAFLTGNSMQDEQQAVHHHQQIQITTQHYQHHPQPYDQSQQQSPTGATQQPHQKTPKKLKTRQQRAQDSFNRRKSIDSGTLRKLAEEMHENPALGGEFPILSQLLGESQFSASERRTQALYRHKSTEALYSQF